VNRLMVLCSNDVREQLFRLRFSNGQMPSRGEMGERAIYTMAGWGAGILVR
jgi:hypothetical protein